MRPTIISNVAFTPAASDTSHARRIRAAAGRDYRRRGFLRRLAVEIEHDDVRALSAEECRNRPADAGAAAGDDGDFSAEIEQEICRRGSTTLCR